jgi:hypothetical protein
MCRIAVVEDGLKEKGNVPVQHQKEQNSHVCLIGTGFSCAMNCAAAASKVPLKELQIA